MIAGLEDMQTLIDQVRERLVVLLADAGPAATVTAPEPTATPEPTDEEILQGLIDEELLYGLKLAEDGMGPAWVFRSHVLNPDAPAQQFEIPPNGSDSGICGVSLDGSSPPRICLHSFEKVGSTIPAMKRTFSVARAMSPFRPTPTYEGWSLIGTVASPRTGEPLYVLELW